MLLLKKIFAIFVGIAQIKPFAKFEISSFTAFVDLPIFTRATLC